MLAGNEVRVVTRRALSPARLRAIEAAAESAREQAEANLQLLGFVDSGAFDLMEAIVGPTTAVPNLTTNGERLAGMLDCTGILPRVFYEAYDPLHRQRFSAAHEVGHFVLHESRRRGIVHGCAQAEVDPPPEDAETTSGNEEAEANAFAAALLLPAHDLQQAVQHFGLCWAFLAERFCVSETALRRRWAALKGNQA